MKRLLYFYLIRNTPATIRQLVPAHVQYWPSRNLPSYMGGPFADRTGALITFAAASLDDAQHIIRDLHSICLSRLSAHRPAASGQRYGGSQ